MAAANRQLAIFNLQSVKNQAGRIAESEREASRSFSTEMRATARWHRERVKAEES
jgi:hypothetical protein